MPSRRFALPLAAALVFSTAAVPAQARPTPADREIDNVAAFARLHGVVRYFYPSDAAAELDWDRFAVHGVARVRSARDATELAAALRQLVAPLGPGIQVGTTLPAASPATASGEPLVAWRYLGPGFSTMGGAYRAKRTHRAAPGPADGFVTLMQTLPAEALRGKAIRLRGQVRAPHAGAGGGAALWLRVDRPNQVMGFFDNMADRMVREPEWRSCAIEGTVADDAESIAFGVMAVGAVTADFDALEIAVKDAGGEWTPVPMQDAGFEAAEGEKSGWFKTGARQALVERPAEGAPQGKQYLRFAPRPAAAIDAELYADGAPKAGTRADVDLGGGLKARVPLVLTDAEASLGSSRAADLETLRAALRAVPSASALPGIDERLADVVVAWNVFRHFYPYWTEAGVDWNRRLAPHLQAARAAQTRAAQLEALRALVADVRDGHGFVADTLDKTARGTLPIGLAVVEGHVAVVSSATTEVPVGAVVTTIDGTPAADRLGRATALASGSTQWRQARAGWALAGGVKDAEVKLGLHDGSGTRVVTLRYDAAATLPVKRPAAVVELDPGLWYVDLTRAKMPEIAPKLETVAKARGVVFDMRGYPTDAGAGILPHLLDAPETDRWMHVARIVAPFYETAGWEDFGWDVKPANPRLEGKIVFLTDAGAISYAESVMGYVADRKLGTIVGGTTAGTNGNVATFVTPGGFNIGFTGMRVTRHDGRSPHHLVGVTPDVAVNPTIAGLRAGRDEVLERGLAVIRESGNAAAAR